MSQSALLRKAIVFSQTAPEAVPLVSNVFTKAIAQKNICIAGEIKS